ncbi:MAG: PaaI family thioesterase, partial [Caulobacteraceae bacterium]|nr:PaaI family thioesterase [Caulobacteraceae bacterium]
MADGGDAGTAGPLLIEDGEWAGWSCWRGTDPFEDLVGPYYFREEAAGRMRCAFRAEARHMNGMGFLHGGAVLAFIDFSLFIIARDALKGDPGVTVSLNAEFTSPGQLGAL